MKKITSLLILIFACISVSAQNTFQKAIGGALSETGTSIQHTPDGNYIISGFTTSFPGPDRDAYLVKTDVNGNVLWSNVYGGANDELCYYVSVCHDGGFILAGGTTSFGSGQNDVYLLRTDAVGNFLWSTTVGGTFSDYGWFVLQTADRGFLATGFSEACAGGCYKGLLVKTDSLGTVQWTKIVGGSNSQEFYGIDATSDGGFIVTGKIATNSFGSSDTWLVKLNAAGDTMWTRNYGMATEESGAVVRQTSDGGYIITGDIHNASNIHHASLLKTDSLGNLLWAKTFGAPDSTGGEFGWDVRQLADHGYIITGSTPAYGNSMQILVVRTDSSGNMLWSKIYGGILFDDPWYSILTPGEGLAIVGATESFGSGEWDIYLLKIDSLGSINGCNDSSVVPEAVTRTLQTGSGTIITTGMLSTNPLMTTNNPATITVQICPPVGVAEVDVDGSSVLVYPNPVTNELIIKNDELRIESVEVYDVLGGKVINLTSPFDSAQGDARIDVSSLVAGMYFLKVTDGSGEQVVKFVKQ